MRTSLIEIAQIEGLVEQYAGCHDDLLRKSWVQRNSDLKEKIVQQLTSYELIKVYGRRQLKKEIEAVEKQMFKARKHRAFQCVIQSIFKKR